MSSMSRRHRMTDQDATLCDLTSVGSDQPCLHEADDNLSRQVGQASGVADAQRGQGSCALSEEGSPGELPVCPRSTQEILQSSDETMARRDCLSSSLTSLKGGVGQEHQFNYIAEAQVRLHSISVFLWVPESAPVSTSSLVFTVSNECSTRLTVCTKQPRSGAKCEPTHFDLPVPAKTTTSIVEPLTSEKSTLWTIRLQIRSRADADITPKSSEQTQPLSAKELQAMRPLALRCRSCQTAVADVKHVVRYLQLPSQHWEELVDAWMCHADQELSTTIVQAQQDLAQHSGLNRSRVHVSDGSIIVERGLLSSSVSFNNDIEVSNSPAS